MTRRHYRMLLLLAALAACEGRPGPLAPTDDSPGGPPPQDPAGVPMRSVAIVSDPVSPAAESYGAAASVTPVTYVSFLPGTYPEGRTVRITNRRTGASLVADLADGGLDPVAVPAESGDTLRFAVNAGGTEVEFDQLVPNFYAVTVVRTEPPAGKRDVPLNLRARVVFSEPVDGVTIAENFGITIGDVAVAGEVSISADGLEATFQPATPLLAATEYTLTVGGGIRDLDGSPLRSPVSAPFVTVAAPADPSALRGMLAFTGSGGLHLMNLDGSGRVALTPDNLIGAYDYGAAWGPYGGTIAFARHDGQWGATLHVIEADGTGLRQLSPAGVYDADPTWSPDGRRIAFEHREDRTSVGHIWVMDAYGRNRVRLTDNLQPNFHPAWSPDGERIAYVTYDEAGMGIHLMKADGSDRVRLTSDSVQGSDPAWSPDGSRLAFVGDNGLHRGLFLMNADGTGVEALIAGDVEQPSWSPDGEMLVYTVPECDPWTYPGLCTGEEPSVSPLWVYRLSDRQAFRLSVPSPAQNAAWRPNSNGYWDY